jgi:predicted CXXCH cytochrome family protein
LGKKGSKRTKTGLTPTSRPSAIWIGAGVIVLLLVAIIVLSRRDSGKPPVLTSSTTPTAPARKSPLQADYAGIDRCSVCHQAEHQGWKQSFHSRAMEPATPQTVLGNFRSYKFDREGTTAEMFTEGEKFFMKARDRTSSFNDYQVAFTFGAKHMQDYLTVLPNGRIQVLPVYYHVTGKEWVDFTTIRQGRLSPDHPFYWTNFRRSFNKECFDCHVTGMEINYDTAADRFDTKWIDLSVSCESCHGPGATHADSPSADNIINPRKLERERELAICARCHGPKSPHFSIYSRRHRYSPGDSYGDFFTPLLPLEGGAEESSDFYIDGRPKNSSYEYQAMIQSRCFLNSKMTCLTCHTAPHNAKAENELPSPATNNALCANCHKNLTDNVTAHTRHKPEGAAALCVSCHMPKLITGVLDKFADHSIDIPNPDNTRDFQIPNACNDCHKDKSVNWAVEQYRKLYPENSLLRRKVIAAAFALAGKPEVERALALILTNAREAPFLRANAAALLAAYRTPNTIKALSSVLSDSDYLVRARAAASLASMREAATDREARAGLSILLSDNNPLVRVQAANALLNFGDERGIGFFESLTNSPEYGDWFRTRGVLANYYYVKGDLSRAETELQQTLADKPDYIEAMRLLAVVEEKLGKRQEAAEQWRRILIFDPGNKQAADRLRQGF